MKAYVFILLIALGVFFLAAGLSGFNSDKGRRRFEDGARMPLAAGSAIATLGALLLWKSNE